MMKPMTGGVLVLTILATCAADLMAQRGLRGRRGQGVEARGGGVESVMRLRDRLELTDDQINSLDALRRSQVQAQNDDFAARNELQSQMQAGHLDRSDFTEAMRARREADLALAEQRRSELEAILTEEQIESLGQTRARARAFARGRASARPGQRGLRQRREIRGGQGFGPNRGQGFRGRGIARQRGFRGGIGA